MSTSVRALAESVLAFCEHCDKAGPSARLTEHYRVDHPEIFWGEPKAHLKSPAYSVTIPSRFQRRLERISEQTGRSVGQIIASLLDAQGLGRTVRPGVNKEAS